MVRAEVALDVSMIVRLGVGLYQDDRQQGKFPVRPNNPPPRRIASQHNGSTHRLPFEKHGHLGHSDAWNVSWVVNGLGERTNLLTKGR